MLNLREGDKVTRIPALQAVLRSQIALAAKGNGPAQRAVVKTVQEMAGFVEQFLNDVANEVEDRRNDLR